MGPIAPSLSDAQLTKDLALYGISPIFLKAMRTFTNKSKGARADLSKEANVVLAKHGLALRRSPEQSARLKELHQKYLDKTITKAELDEYQANNLPLISKAVADDIEELSGMLQRASSDFDKAMISQMIHLVVEKERGTGIFNLIAALPYNAALAGLKVVQGNVFGSVSTMYANMFTAFSMYSAEDLVGMNGNALALQKNWNAIVYGHLSEQWSRGTHTHGLNSLSRIALSGAKGDAVEAMSKALGTIRNTQTAIYGRQGTPAAERDTGSAQDMINTFKRLATIMFFDLGSRFAMAPDAYFSTVATNTYKGQMVYRLAWDNWLINKDITDKSQSQYIADFIDQELELKPMEFYLEDSRKWMKTHKDVIMGHSVSIRASDKEVESIITARSNAIRNEARDAAIVKRFGDEGEQLVEDARSQGYASSFSNETKGYEKWFEEILKALGLHFIGKLFAKLDRTIVIQNENMDVRLRTGSANPFQFAILPFPGYMARAIGETLNWTPLGFILKKGWNLLEPDVYTKLEVYSTFTKGVIGLGLAAVPGYFFGFFDGDDDEEKRRQRGYAGYKPHTIYGPKGQETVIPPYSLWWKDGDKIRIFKYQNFPQLMATLGVWATVAEAHRKQPDVNAMGFSLQIGLGLASVVNDTGLYDTLSNTTRLFKPDPYADIDTFSAKAAENFAKQAKMYAMPLSSLQKDLIGITRGYEVTGRQGNLWATYLANTLFEGSLSEEARANLSKALDANGNVKSTTALSRFYEELEKPSEGLLWMIGEHYGFPREDYKKPLANAFPSERHQKDSATVIFQEMNNGMFYIKHAPEIEKAASKYYWPWISAYSTDEKRKNELQDFVASPTNKLKEKQGENSATLRGLQQEDINKMVARGRQIAELEITAQYYTTEPRVQKWVKAIAEKEAKEGVKLSDHKQIKGIKSQGSSK